ncbi:hypothetical protein KKF86_03855, partial [bacterium]|nr:hypothetical protein [bacterium]
MMSQKESNAKIELRNQRVSDAKRFFKILKNPNFTYFNVCPKDLEAEKAFLKLNADKRKGSRLVERFIYKDFEHSLIDIFMPIIKSKFTFFQMQIEQTFMYTPEFR